MHRALSVNMTIELIGDPTSHLLIPSPLILGLVDALANNDTGERTLSTVRAYIDSFDPEVRELLVQIQERCSVFRFCIHEARKVGGWVARFKMSERTLRAWLYNQFLRQRWVYPLRRLLPS